MITLSGAKALVEAMRGHQARRHRMTLLVELEPSQNRLLPLLLLQLNCLCRRIGPYHKSVYIGSLSAQITGLSDCHHQPLGTAKQLLGQEAALAILDWRTSDAHHYRADDLGAMGGILVAGGLCVLITEQVSTPNSPFLKRLYQRSNHHQIHSLVLSDKFINELTELVQNLLKLTSIERSGTAGICRDDSSKSDMLYTQGQQNAIAALIKVVTGHRRRPLVLTADRGRGKSTVLGLACAELLKRGKQNIGVTAHRPQALSAVFEHAQYALPEADTQNRTIHWQGGEIRFIPVDQLLDETTAIELDALLVDEAAAIPAPQLKQLLERYPRIAFTSTIHGYEGTGRGFSLRFLPYLEQNYPQYQAYELTEPLRWAQGDPLEAWLFDVLLLDAEPANFPSSEMNLADIDYRLLSGADLTQEETLLRQAFGLLVQAHYQTSPDDLARLLDDPAFSLLLACKGERVLGVIMLVKETLADNDIALKQQIVKGERRPKGNLLLQQLVSQYGDAAVLDWQGYRVVRIAVLDELRRSGFGSQLLQKLKIIAAEHAYDFIGSSFAATQDVIAFWQHNGYQTVQLGSKRDAASGCYSASVINPLTPKVIDTTAQYQVYFTYQAFHAIPVLWPKLTPELARQLFGGLPSQSIELDFIEQQNQVTLKRFSQGECSYEVAIPALRRMLEQPEIDKALFELVYQRLVLGLSWQQCGFTGRKQGVEVMRELLLLLLRNR